MEASPAPSKARRGLKLTARGGEEGNANRRDRNDSPVPISVSRRTRKDSPSKSSRTLHHAGNGDRATERRAAFIDQDIDARYRSLSLSDDQRRTVGFDQPADRSNHGEASRSPGHRVNNEDYMEERASTSHIRVIKRYFPSPSHHGRGWKCSRPSSSSLTQRECA